MLFNSIEFIPFLALALGAFYFAPHAYRRYVVLVTGYVFYGWWDWRFAILLGVTTIGDHFFATSIDDARATGDGNKANRHLAASLTMNLGVLFFFKYFNFFTDGFVQLAGAFGLQASAPVIRVLLPVGISFYTFQEMSYVIDVWRGKLRATRSLLNFANYVVFFPQLVAGPIERATTLLPQITELKPPTRQMVKDGLCLVFTGFVKKVALGDQIAFVADAAFAEHATLSAGELWLGIVAFGLQIYFDFSGYSDIARGIAKWFGVEIMVNFRRPLIQTNVTDAWNRWHISLSTWVRDYIYIPIGGGRGGTVRTIVNVLFSMTLVGLWHGANWTYILFGLMHGSYLCFHRVWKLFVPTMKGWPGAIIGYVLTQLCILMAFVAFRSPDIHSAGAYYRGLFDFSRGFGVDALALIFLCYVVLFAVDGPAEYFDDEYVLHRLSKYFRYSIYAVGFAIVIGLMASRPEGARAFVYFQF